MPGRPQSDDLRNIIQLLRKPHITKVDPVPSDERCYICYRDFDAPPDMNDTEPPCKPMQLHPCGHLIGDTCYAKLTPHQQTRCLLCTRDIADDSPIPKILATLCDMDHFGHFSPAGLLGDAARLPLAWSYLPGHGFPSFYVLLIGNGLSRMQAQLFNRGVYTKRDALRLWLTHLAFLFGYQANVAYGLAVSLGLRFWILLVLNLTVCKIVSPSSLPFPGFHDYILGFLGGVVVALAALILFCWKNEPMLERQLERAVTPCVWICGMAFESWLTGRAKQVNALWGFEAAACFVLTPFALYAFSYAFLAGWLIYLGWRHRTPIFV